MQKFKSRETAGQILATDIEKLNLENPYLLGIPRGGIQVAEPIAERLNIPINPLVVKKLPAPNNPEFGFGAVTEDGTKVLNEEAVNYLHLNNNLIESIAEKVVTEICHRKEVYGGLDDEAIARSDVIIVDDGVATGYSLIAGIKTVKNRNPKSLTVAVPVSSSNAYEKVKSMADNIVCPIISDEYYFAVANYYEEWFDLTEQQIKDILNKHPA